MGAHHLALPFRRLAVRTEDPGTRNGDLRRSECTGQRTYPPAVPVAGDGHSSAILHRAAPVARTRERHLKFFFDHGLDEAAHLRTQLRLDRIEPIVEKLFHWPHRPASSWYHFSWRNLHRRANADSLFGTTWRLRHLQFPTTSATAPLNVPNSTVHDDLAVSEPGQKVPEVATSSSSRLTLHTLIHQRHLTPSCGGQAPT